MDAEWGRLLEEARDALAVERAAALRRQRLADIEVVSSVRGDRGMTLWLSRVLRTDEQVLVETADGGHLLNGDGTAQVKMAAGAGAGPPAGARGSVLPVGSRGLLERLDERLVVLRAGGPSWFNVDLALKVFGLRASRVEEAPVRFQDLNDQQNRAVRLALGSEVTFIDGPPGTGKTATLARLVAALLVRGRRVLVVGATNHAVTALLGRLMGQGDGAIERVALRVGADRGRCRALSVEKALQARAPGLLARLAEAREEIASARGAGRGSPDQRRALLARVRALRREIAVERRALVAEARLVGATAHQCYLRMELFSGFDTVVVDEAGMLAMPLAVLVGGLARRSVVFGGDPRQLPVVAQGGWASRYSLDPFQAGGALGCRCPVFLRRRTAALVEQYRMDARIADLVSTLFYDGALRSPGGHRAPLSAVLPPLALVDTSGWRPEAVRVLGGSRRNDVHAELINRFLTPLEILLPPQVSLGVATPYAGQARCVGRALQGSRWDGAVGTVHSLQGEERDLVVFDTVEADGLPLGRFFGWRGEPHLDVGARLLNVGLSRARTHLFVLADVRYLESGLPRGAPFRRLLCMARERGLVIEATVLLERVYREL